MSSDDYRRGGDCNCFAVRSAARHVSQLYDQHLASTGLRTTQFSILRKLHLKGPMTINGLAEEMVSDRTTLGRNILPLQREGLISIAPSATDRRAKELHVTNAGERRFKSGEAAWARAQAQFEATFGVERAAELRVLLGAVVASDFAVAVV